jgi:hypothetical protein
MKAEAIGLPNEAEALFRDLDKPSLHALSYVLRHPDTWPEDFFWDYTGYDTCAMGLAHAVWKKHVPEPPREYGKGASQMARAFKMPFDKAGNIFFHGASAYRYQLGPLKLWLRPYGSITPEMVADAIDQYLAAVE